MEKAIRSMNNAEWKYFFLTTEKRVRQFEQDRAILRKMNFSSEVEEIILKLKGLRIENKYDIDLISWMTANSTKWDTAKEISEQTQDYDLEHKSFNYLDAILNNLFSYYHFLPHHQKYCIIEHGYPIDINYKLSKYEKYIIYEEDQDLYETVKISNAGEIKKIMREISSLNLPVSMQHFNELQGNVLFLQYEIDL
jgi:hypothetical protein